MRVLMLLAKSTGGIGTHVDDLTRELRALGHRVDLATDALTATTFGWDDAQIVWPERTTRVGESIAALRSLARGADVVHAHGHQAGSLASVAVRTLSRRDRPALVVSLHNAVLGGRRRRALGAATAAPFSRVATLVTGASSDLVDQARDWGATWTELAAVPSPRVPRLLAAGSLSRSERGDMALALMTGAGVDCSADAELVLTIARIAPQKDLATFVAAAAADRSAAQRAGAARSHGHRHREWVVVGGGDPVLGARLQAEVDRLRAPVHFVGAQSDPSPWLRAASAFVLTSTWEARALVVQEAMAAGTPVVTRDVGGLRDLAEGTGTLVQGSEPQRWAAAVSAVVDDEVAWESASRDGRTRAASWDDGAQTATRWVAWYAQSRAMT